MSPTTSMLPSLSFMGMIDEQDRAVGVTSSHATTRVTVRAHRRFELQCSPHRSTHGGMNMSYRDPLSTCPVTLEVYSYWTSKSSDRAQEVKRYELIVSPVSPIEIV